MKQTLFLFASLLIALPVIAQTGENYPPRNAQFNPLTSVLSWDEPRITALLQDFTDAQFPPPDWNLKNGQWFRTNNGNGGSFIIPEWDSDYACVNDSLNQLSDTLITPGMDLSIHNNFSLVFDSYYDGQGEQAAIYYSYDAFESCELLKEMIPASEWEQIIIDLSDLSGIINGNIWFGFAGSQWAIDNVDILVRNETLSGLVNYHLFLEDVLVDSTTETSYFFDTLSFNQSYTVGVAARYNTGLSEKISFSFTSEFLNMPQNLVAATYDNSIKVMWETPMVPNMKSSLQNTDSIPANLIGFQLYLNNDPVAFIESVDGQENYEHWNYDVSSGIYVYDVTALYDATIYGMPGDTVESGKNGPCYIFGGYHVILPFIEQWDAGTFEYREWSVDSENWMVNQSVGNPANSAEFSGIPQQGAYSSSLISYPINLNGLKTGTFYFDFDLKLNDIAENETENLIVGLEINNTFFSIDTLSNKGTTDWEGKHYDITSSITGIENFRLVFEARGENSTNIEGWFIDNIHVYQMCDEPTNLSLEPEFGYEYTIAHLDWQPPAMHYQWLYYHDNAFENAFSAMEPGYGFAQLFEPADYPATIQKAKFFIGDHLNYQNNIDVSILSGDGNAVLAGPITVNAVEGNSWITINFGEITIEEGNFLVYIQNLEENGPFLAVDDHIQNPGLYYGNMGNFTELNQWGYQFVSSCQAYIKYSPSDNIVENSKSLKPASQNFKPHFLQSFEACYPDNQEKERSLTGYNIWRNDELIESAWPESHYSDTLTEAGEFSYFISAVYDQCESDTLGTVSISLFTDIPETSKQNQINIYPNPASDQLIIETEAQDAIIHHFTLTSVSGQPVVSLSPDNRRIRLDVSLLPEGIYLAEIFSGGKREFRKIIIY